MLTAGAMSIARIIRDKNACNVLPVKYEIIQQSEFVLGGRQVHTVSKSDFFLSLAYPRTLLLSLSSLVIMTLLFLASCIFGSMYT